MASSSSSPSSAAPPLDATDLQQALEGRFPYHLLSASLQQRLSPQDYRTLTVRNAVLRWHSYHRLPEFARATVTETAYYEAVIQYGSEQLQLYPYVHERQILFHTRETPLSYYVRMIAEMLKAERSYDRLPNFTANDILNLLGIGRNQYLDTTKNVRSKLRWHVNRNYVPDHLPSELLPSVTLDPFWVIVPVVEPTAQQGQQSDRVDKLCRGHPEDAALFRLLVTKGGQAPTGAAAATTTTTTNTTNTTTTNTTNTTTFALSSSFHKKNNSDRQHLHEALQVDRQVLASDAVYACQLPRESVHRLYRKALVCADFTIAPEDLVVVPPLETFVMNRTSDDPLEVLLYRVLSTLDDRTPLQLLAQLLMVAEEDVCAAVHALVRLGLARKKYVQVPEAIGGWLESVHPSWLACVNELLQEQHHQQQQQQRQQHRQRQRRLGSEPARAAASNEEEEEELPAASAAAAAGGGGGGGLAVDRASHTAQSDSDVFAGSQSASFTCGSDNTTPAAKRIALLYDATLTGFLMMTNLSRDPAFKQHAVTLFEVGKMSDELVGSFLKLLEQVNVEEVCGFGGEAQKYMTSAVSLRELLKTLRGIRLPDGSTSGVDLLKIESLNELEATTRYSVLGRNYWAYVTTAPVATAPYIDVELGCVYGNTASLMASPWLLLFLYERMRQGPPTVLIPFGSQLHSWPLEFLDREEPPQSSLSLSLPSEEDEVLGYAARVRMQTITLDAEVSHANLDTSLLLVNEMAVTAPAFVQCIAPVPLVAHRGRRDGAVGEQTGYRRLEVTLPFTATPADVRFLLTRRLLEDFSEPSVTAGVAETLEATDPIARVDFADGCAGLAATLAACVAALQLQDSLGYLTCSVTLHQASAAVSVNDLSATTTTTGTVYAVEQVDVVGLGLGVSLTHPDCCACALASLPRLLSEEASERHNAAMRRCVADFSAFLERYSTLTRDTYVKLALKSAASAGPMTQQQLRKVGGGGAAPFPSTTIIFTGQALQLVDDANPLSEQWSA